MNPPIKRWVAAPTLSASSTAEDSCQPPVYGSLFIHVGPSKRPVKNEVKINIALKFLDASVAHRLLLFIRKVL
jgi:hypothetical protein